MSTPRHFMVATVIAIVVVCAQSAHAQNHAQDSIVFKPEVEKKFVQGMHFFTAANYDSAAEEFTALIRLYPRSHRATGAYIMGAKAQYHRRKFRESIKLLKDLLDLYPDSRYGTDAHYTLGLDYYRLSRYEDAAGEFLTSLQTTNDAALAGRAVRMIDQIASSQLTLGQLQILAGDAKTDEVKALANFRLAEKLNRSGDTKSAMDVLRGVIHLPSGIKYVGEALALLERLEKGGVIKIGVLLPLMLKNEKRGVREQGVEFLEGMQFAVEEFNQTAVIKAALDVRDTERDPSVAAKQVTDLCSDARVTAVVGPLSSNEVFACAGIANARGVPLITPTATANGIASIGPYIYQANPDFDIRGRTMAEYAYSRMQAKRAAVIAPRDAVGKFVADAFLDEFKKLGGEIVDAEWYDSGTSDLRPLFTTMRQKGFSLVETAAIDFGGKMKNTDIAKMVKWGISRGLIDSLIESAGTVPVEQLFGRGGRHVVDSLKIPYTSTSLRVDSLGLPVTTIDAIFAPIASSDEIAVVSSQMKLFNFQAQLLGTQDWNDLGELDQNRQYTDGVIFSSDSYVDEEDPAYKILVGKFQKSFKGRKPTLNTLFGYDVMKMLLEPMTQGVQTRNDLAGALLAVHRFKGMHSPISFAPSRVNVAMSILQYKSRTIRRIGDIDITDRIPHTY